MSTLPGPFGSPSLSANIGARLVSAWRLLGVSFGVMRREPSLIALTLLSTLLRLAIFALLFVGIAALFGVDSLGDLLAGQAEADKLVSAVFAFVMAGTVWSLLFGAWFSAFFGGAVSFLAMERMEGRDPSLLGGIAAAFRRFGPLLVFGLVSTVVGFLSGVSFGSGSSTARSVANTAQRAAAELYRLLTSLSLPVIMREGISGTAAIGRSTAIVRAVWPQALASGIGVRTAVASLAAMPYLLMVAIFMATVFALPSSGVSENGMREIDFEVFAPAVLDLLPAFAVLGLIALAIGAVGALLEAIFNSALYLYATTGRAGDFAPEDLAAAAVTSDGVVKPGAAKQ